MGKFGGYRKDDEDDDDEADIWGRKQRTPDATLECPSTQATVDSLLYTDIPEMIAHHCQNSLDSPHYLSPETRHTTNPAELI